MISAETGIAPGKLLALLAKLEVKKKIIQFPL